MELDSRHDILNGRLDAIDAELNDVEIRLSKLYDALETNKLSLDDLAPRIKEIRSLQNELSKARLLLEAEKVTRLVKPRRFRNHKGLCQRPGVPPWRGRRR